MLAKVEMAKSKQAQQLNLSNNTSDATARQIFDFFGLPAELRNEIYSHLTEDVKLDSGEDRKGVAVRSDVVVKDTVIINCLLLNRQFKEEYEHEIASRQTLVFTDTNYNVERVELRAKRSRQKDEIRQDALASYLLR